MENLMWFNDLMRFRVMVNKQGLFFGEPLDLAVHSNAQVP